jgi:hypothetical protein
VGQGLTDAIVGQLGASFEDFVDTVWISKGVGEEEATREQDNALLVLLHNLGAEGNDVSH